MFITKVRFHFKHTRPACFEPEVPSAPCHYHLYDHAPHVQLTAPLNRPNPLQPCRAASRKKTTMQQCAHPPPISISTVLNDENPANDDIAANGRLWFELRANQVGRVPFGRGSLQCCFVLPFLSGLAVQVSPRGVIS
jgi:hypothetical protein